MSVINQALRQLDQRTQRQSEGVDILITAPHRPPRMGYFVVGVGVVAILFAVGGYWLGQQLPTLLASLTPTTASPITDSTPQPPTQPYSASAGSITTTADSALPPFISRLSPNPTPSSPTRQLYTLSGSALQTVTAAEICLPNGRCQQIPAARFVQQGELEIQLYLIPGSGPEQWLIQLLSPNGNSNRYQLDILPPSPATPPPTTPAAAVAPAPEIPPRPVAALPSPADREPPIATTGVATIPLKAAPIPPPAPVPTPAPKGVGQFTKQSHPLSASEQVQQLYQQGVQQQQSGDESAAIESWQRLLEINPQHHASREAAVNSLLRTPARQPEAVALLLKGIAVAPNYVSYRLLLARLYSNNPNQIPQAVELLKAGLAIQPNHAEMNATLAALYQRQGQHSHVLSHYRTALNSEPQHARWWIGLAISQEALGNSQGALASYQQAARQNDPLLTGQLASFVQRKIETLQP